jgi:hypothetical protein
MKNRSTAMREAASKAMSAGRRNGRIAMAAETRAAIGREIASRPGARQRLSEIGRKGRLARTPEANAAAAAKQSATLRRKREERLAWCPLDRRDEFHKLSGVVGVKEAKRVILADLAALEKRRLAALTPLDRQLERVRNGARLVEVRPLPGREHAFTLGGVSGGML